MPKSVGLNTPVDIAISVTTLTIGSVSKISTVDRIAALQEAIDKGARARD